MSITINGTTGVSGVDGSSTTPAFQGTDTDTGLFYSANTVSVSAGGSKVATINAYGIGLGTGSPSSGIGITFPATQSASSDANTLDDYEEGTWTPSISTASGWTSGTPSSVTATYTKIGNTVRLYAAFTLGSSTGNVTANDRFTMTGAPFAAADPAFGILSGAPDITVPITWLGNSLISSTTIYGVCLTSTGSPARNTTIRISLVYQV